MKIESSKINFKKMDENVYRIYHDTDVIQFWSPVLKAPFGVDENFGKYYIQLDLHEENNTQQKHLKKIIEKVESVIKKRLNLEDHEMKNIFRRQIGNRDLMEVRIKMMKNSVLTDIEYENKRDSYLKTLFDIEENSYVKVNLEVHGFWDHRDINSEEKKTNKVGLILNATKIKVMDKAKYERNIVNFEVMGDGI